MRFWKILGWFFLIMLLPFPLWMYLGWYFSPSKPLSVAIIDKTVLTRERKEHESLNWVLTNQKYVKPDGELYSISKDYFGFFPKLNGKYEIHGLENFNPEQIDTLADASDAVYIADTYGIFASEWYTQKEQTEHSSMIYGGLSPVDMMFLQNMKKKKKLIMTEFNTIASPTNEAVRADFETTFDLRWTGWSGRYFESLDTLKNPELPRWLVRDYKLQHSNRWPFKQSGIALVHYDTRVEILENKTHLTQEVPYILTNKENCERFELPEKIKYPYWFDVMLTKRSNNVVSIYSVYTNAKGDSILESIGIPKVFPAVIEHTGDYLFYYFSGDFCDNPIEQFTAKIKGVRAFRWFFYNGKEIPERRSFFWEYYSPLVTKILANYSSTLKH